METTTSTEMKKRELKHLGFVKVAAVNTIMCLSSVYEYAKQNSGPLKSTVGAVEGAVTTVVSPVYEKFKGVPDDLLGFLDEKVGVASEKFDEHAPPLAKHLVSKTHDIIVKASQVTQDLINHAKTDGPRAAAHYAASESKQLVFIQSAKIWTRLDQIPPFHMLADIAVPTAAHWSEKYNKVVVDMSCKGHVIFSYLPLVPIDDIAKAFKPAGSAKEEEGEDGAAPAHEAQSQSD